MLENIADKSINTVPYDFEINEYWQDNKKRYLINLIPTIKQIVGDMEKCEKLGIIAGRFHSTVSELTLSVCRRVSMEKGIKKVVLSGGVFQNRLLSNLLYDKLLQNGFAPYFNKNVPSNDGGLSLGQAYIAALIHESK